MGVLLLLLVLLLLEHCQAGTLTLCWRYYMFLILKDIPMEARLASPPLCTNSIFLLCWKLIVFLVELTTINTQTNNMPAWVAHQHTQPERAKREIRYYTNTSSRESIFAGNRINFIDELIKRALLNFPLCYTRKRDLSLSYAFINTWMITIFLSLIFFHVELFSSTGSFFLPRTGWMNFRKTA